MDSENTLAMHYGQQVADAWILIPGIVLIYDHALTLESEIKFVWGKPKRLSFFLFVVLRYVSLLSNVGICHDLTLEKIGIIILQCVLAGSVLALRVYAMYNYNKIILLFVIPAGSMAVGLAVWSIAGGTWVLATQEIGCEYPVSKQSAIRMAGAWEAQFLCDVIVFVFTLRRSYREPFKIPGSLLSHMTRDGALYFAVLALVNLANILMYYFVVGSSGVLSSYRASFKLLANAPELIQRGYDHYPDGIFRACFAGKMGNTPEHIISFREGIEGTIQGKLTMGRDLADNPYHIHTIRTNLTRNLHACFPDVRDEIVCAFDDVIQLQGSGAFDFIPLVAPTSSYNIAEWIALPVLPTTMAIVARVSDRLFVGLPISYLCNNIQHTIDVIRSANRITLFPPFLRPLVAPWISSKDKSFTRALNYVGPLLEDRLEKERELGLDWPGKTNDFISWLMEIAEEKERTVSALTLRLLSTNMAALHISSIAFTHALFDLTTHPEHLLPMREEAERVVKDNFLRESQRINNNGPRAFQHLMLV
ncbi:hypothetical protein C8R47DRAFT_1209797 [Mycena vitilis]|nr:hypothetical protein C8R47DRAFT_1209797 [Mycena vitilis]